MTTSFDVRETLIESPTHENTSGAGYKRTYNYRQWRNQVVEALYLTGFDIEAEAFGKCAENPMFWQSPDKKIPGDVETVWMCSGDLSHDCALFCATCDNRCCPDCAARQSARFISRYLPKALELGLSGGRYRIRHIVLTTPIALTSDTSDNIRKLYRKYSKLPRKALDIVAKRGKELGRSWKTLGCLQSAEFGSDGEKLHFHIVQYGDYIPQDELSKAWEQVTDGNAYVVRVYSLKADEDSLTHAIVETLKYSTKFWKTGANGEVEYLPPNVIPHLMQVLKGTRRVKSWGVFYNLPEIETEDFCCPECGSNMVRMGVENLEIYQEGIEHILRFKLANKSHIGGVGGNKSPPKNSYQGVNMDDKTKFSYEMMNTPALAAKAKYLKIEIDELQEKRRGYGAAHENYKTWTDRQNSAKRERAFVLRVLKSRQMQLL
ncbi:MAG: protein rep [Aliifodinibius sp.]|nr:protein rep [Fodinibius sp.]NIY24872.1 protein rep [Fodinibius sp.]